MNIKIDFDGKTITIIVLVLLLMLGLGYHFNKISEKNEKIIEKENFAKALADSVHHYKNKHGEVVAEKLTLQTDIKDLKDKNLTLTANQQKLVDLVSEINKKNQVISAAVIDMGIKLDGLKPSDNVVETDSTEKFMSLKGDSTLQYEIDITNVKRFNSKLKPTLTFTKFKLPNIQKVEFHWDKNDANHEGNPISFSVTNSNPHYQVYNIDSYAIPELKKKDIKPTFLQKLGKLSKTTGGKIVIFGAGVIVGGYVLHK